MSALEMVEFYAVDMGWRVFPLRPGHKTPATGHGFKDATTDVHQLRAWWRREPRYGVGLACEGFVVLDVDVRDGKPGRESLARLEAQHGELPETWIVATPSGGVHRYFAAIPGRTVERALFPELAIDRCGVGGYVVAPPTETIEARKQSAGVYRWTGDDVGLAVLPAWIADLAAPTKPEPVRGERPRRSKWDATVSERADRALRWIERTEPAIEGSYGSTKTYKVALNLLRGFNLPRSVAKELLAYYSRRCVPPWTDAELERKLDQAEHASRAPAYGYMLRGAS